MIGADSLAYISLESLKASLNTIDCGVCSACFDGDFIAGNGIDPEFDTSKIRSISLPASPRMTKFKKYQELFEDKR